VRRLIVCTHTSSPMVAALAVGGAGSTSRGVLRQSSATSSYRRLALSAAWKRSARRASRAVALPRVRAHALRRVRAGDACMVSAHVCVRAHVCVLWRWWMGARGRTRMLRHRTDLRKERKRRKCGLGTRVGAVAVLCKLKAFVHASIERDAGAGV